MTEKKMVTLKINPDLWRKTKAEACMRGKTLQEFIEEILNLVLKSTKG